MKAKKILSAIVAMLVLFTQASIAKDYSDYPQHFRDVSKDHWAFEYIAELAGKNVVSGYEDNTFRGQGTLTRAEAAALLCRASNLEDDNKTADVESVYNDAVSNADSKAEADEDSISAENK